MGTADPRQPTERGILRRASRAPGRRRQTRGLPGLLSPGAKKAHPLHFAMAEACFAVPAALREWVDGPLAATTTVCAGRNHRVSQGPNALLWCAVVGITELKPYHVYSHIGRGSGEWGAAITLDHRYAIAYTVEMDYAMVGAAPPRRRCWRPRTIFEAAQIGVHLATFIRGLGYPARAHIDGNYRVIAPLVARDAGLGEIGRMGLVMTPDLGPRVRLGVVTTDLPLAPDARGDDTSVLDFCRLPAVGCGADAGGGGDAGGLRRMLALLEFGPPTEFAAMPVRDVDVTPRLAQGGLDIVSDRGLPTCAVAGYRSGEERRVIMYRHVLVRKLSEATGIPALRLQSIWDTPDLAVRCENARLEPVVRRCKQAGTADPNGPSLGKCAWTFPVFPSAKPWSWSSGDANGAADDRRMAAEGMVAFRGGRGAGDRDFRVLLPDDHPHGNFSVVRSRNETPEVIELVKPTHHTKMQGGAVITWSVVHPEPGYTYSSHWQSD